MRRAGERAAAGIEAGGALRAVEKVGLAAFLVATLLAAGAPLACDYELSEERLGALSSHLAEAHRGPVLERLRELEGRRYASVWSFIPDVRAAITAANDDLASADTIWDYTRDQYIYHATRAAQGGLLPSHTGLFFWLTLGLGSLGGLLTFLPRLVPTGRAGEHRGIGNDGVMRSSSRSRGALGIVVGAALIAFYVLLYFYPATIVAWIRLADPVSAVLRGTPSDRWFFYGTLYTLAVTVMGVRMLVHYRHSRYHVVRTTSVIFFQLGFAFLLPPLLESLDAPGQDLKLAWPLDYTFFYDWRISGFTSAGAAGWALFLWGIALSLIVVPLLAVLVGKRWYCSWVCGCGGLAETLGDPFRHLSDKRVSAWRIERWSVHGVLVAAIALTAVVLIDAGTGALGDVTWRVQSWYGFLIGSMFAGVVGTGFYPVMGSRVWCRFGCPLAAVLGLVQRFRSRFRITVNGGQCISCGNCSTYCEMGIDVRWYAQRGQNVVRASCVGCGVCASVCPRGVLRLEDGPIAGRLNDPSRSLVQIGARRGQS